MIGLIPFALGGVVEIDHPEHRAVVGNGHGWHVQFLGALDQLLDIREAIEQRVFGVDVEVGEGHVCYVVWKLVYWKIGNWNTGLSNGTQLFQPGL